jgi:hypothetical protein
MTEITYKKLSPVLLFVYNRPWHTEQTLKFLMSNEHAKECTLYIFSDGPVPYATGEQKEKIEEVRKIVKSEKWCKEVHITESEKNKGLAVSIIEGVSEVIHKHDKVIVLEDDLLTSKFFLKYMNEALNFYENKPSVFSISADRPPYSLFKVPDDYEYDVFVSLRSFSTGWATWKDRWNKVDWSLDYLDNFLKRPEQVRAFNRGGEDLTNLLTLQRDHQIDSWAVRFTFAHFVNHAVAILPCISYVDNIGFDGTGIHSGSDENNYRKEVSKAIENPRFPDCLYEDRRIINAFYSSFYPRKRPLWKKAINRFSRMLGGQNLFVIKKKVYCQ